MTLTVHAQSITANTTITAKRSYSGAKKAEVSLQIRYSPASVRDKKFRHPLIVAEGLDASTLLGEGYVSPRNIGDFLSKVSYSNHKALDSLLVGASRKYDIIYVSWKNSFTHLQNNAYALQAVIEWVNNNKKNKKERNVVVWGNSMGGVVARYALADMERRGKDHQTRLFISYDAPQRGANVPLGLQYMLRHTGRMHANASNMLLGKEVFVPLFSSIPNFKKYFSMLDSPAARQMLILYADKWSRINNSMHDEFYGELRKFPNDGYPKQCRNVAFSNGGRGGGGQQGIRAGEPLINGNLSIISLSTSLSNLAFILLFPLFPMGAPSFHGYLQANTLKFTSQRHALYDAKIWIEQKLLLGLITYKHYATEDTQYQPAGWKRALDTEGGGYFSMTASSPSSFGSGGLIGGALSRAPSLIQPLFVINSGLSAEDRFNFIPTVSALDGNGYDLGFDNRIASKYNEPHLQMDAEKAAWLAAEMETIGCESIVSSSSLQCKEDTLVLTYPCNTPAIWRINGRLLNSSFTGRIGSVEVLRNNNNSLYLTQYKGLTERSNVRVQATARSHAKRVATINFTVVPPARVAFDDTSLKDALERGDKINLDHYPRLTLLPGDQASVDVVGRVTDWGACVKVQSPPFPRGFFYRSVTFPRFVFNNQTVDRNCFPRPPPKGNLTFSRDTFPYSSTRHDWLCFFHKI